MSWTIEDSYRLYRMQNWAENYFSINPQGHVVMNPVSSEAGVSTENHDIYALAQDIRTAGTGFPVLVRFNTILEDRVRKLYDAFSAAAGKTGYQGNYLPVYPIKVNQQHAVVNQLVNTPDCATGLEAGSKPELLACISHAPGSVTIVCNGYKDTEYIRLGLMAQLLGHRVYIVIEKPSEVRLIAEQAGLLGVKPSLGIRIRLASLGEGNWQNTGGEKSKFGFSATGVLDLVASLREYGLIESLNLLHFHMGSQIANLEHFRQGVGEAMQIFVELRKEAVPLTCVDVGGGLAVDYEGSASKSFFSMNYGLEQYADTIVSTVRDVCVRNDLPEPDIITECGRAMTAHHCMMIVEVVDQEIKPELEHTVETDHDVELHRRMQQLLSALAEENCVVSLHETDELMDNMLQEFSDGRLSLAQRARAEYLYFQICRRVFALLKNNAQNEKATWRHLSELLADKYFCNFSIFQSLPDIWGIGQVFPIMPLHRLDSRPDRRVLLKDLTCDSDGRIDHYVDGEGISCTLALHDINDGDEYLLGVFLVGAYQEILGDMHNLFGDTHTVDVMPDDNGRLRIVDTEQGDTVTDVLDIVHYDTNRMIAAFERQVNRCALEQPVCDMIRQQLLASLRSYTYLRPEQKNRGSSSLEPASGKKESV